VTRARCQWCAEGTAGPSECARCRRGTRILARGLWDPEAVQALQWDAGLAWSPLWTLVPEPDASPADLDYAARERKRLDARLAEEAKWRAEEPARRRAQAAFQREQAAVRREQAAVQQRSREARSRESAFRQASLVAQPAEDGGPPIWGPSLPPMMEPPPGTAVFRHAIAESGATCATASGAARCQCGFYRMTWTVADDIG
jgi:hypothetical protein